MNEELTNALTATIDNMDDAVLSGEAHIPDVVRELLIWNGVESLLYYVMSLIGIYIMYKWADKSDLDKWHDNDTDYNGCPSGSPGLELKYLTIVVISIACLCMINLTWLKIMIAPKLYLVEYVINLTTK